MGFWNVVGEIGKGLLNEVKETGAKANSLKDEYQDYSDDRLKSLVRDGRTAEKMAAASILKQRGHGSQS
ncbi:hypothetical protein [Pseudomonas veronii]|jgi:hypothetical protein